MTSADTAPSLAPGFSPMRIDFAVPGDPKPRSPQTSERRISSELKVIRAELGPHLFVVDGSRLYDIEDGLASRIESLAFEDAGLGEYEEIAARLGLLGEGRPPYIDGSALAPPPLYSISLNIAQACNMSCGYCYADAGRFGGEPRLMTMDVARASVDRLIAESAPGSDLVLGYMGGEPLANRRVLHGTTRYAAAAGRDAGLRIRFALTTNGTLIKPEDARLFAEFPFAVTVSIDGMRELHDAQRPMADGTSSYDRLRAGLATMAAFGRPRHLSARVTVTPATGDLLPILDHIIGLGFDEVGFAAVLVSANPSLAFAESDFEPFLQSMVACGRRALAELVAGRVYPFGNFETALQQIHRGTHRPYPCGAGAGYLSANAEGKLFACHRLIDDERFAMGSVTTGSDQTQRSAHLTRSHVDGMEPCRGCWARYLCGGGCYHEVSRRGRPGCDYIRGWLEFCLAAYAEVSMKCPEYFARSGSGWSAISSPTTVDG